MPQELNHHQGNLKLSDTNELFYQYWLPKGTPRAALVVAHGVAEHSGRYMNLVNNLVPQGYAVYSLDHLGHGRSTGKRVYVNRFHDYVDGLDLYMDRVREWQPDLPIFLVGHSMGGLISTAFLLEHQAKLSGAILSGPGVKIPDTISQATIMAARFFSFLFPKMGIQQIEAKGISQDPAVVKAYEDDPLVFSGKITARLGAELLNTCGHVMENAGDITLPILILQGTADTIVDPTGAQNLYEKVESSDKTLTFYQDFFHEIFNEPDHKRVFEDVHTWLKARI